MPNLKRYFCFGITHEIYWVVKGQAFLIKLSWSQILIAIRDRSWIKVWDSN